MIYYVYVYKTPVELTIGTIRFCPGDPFYIGKGKGKRAWDHLTEKVNKKINYLKHGVIDKIRAAGAEPIIEFISECLSEYDAHVIETSEILKYGRIAKGTGILTNLTEGGEGGSGYTHTEEIKKKWSAARKGVIPANKFSSEAAEAKKREEEEAARAASQADSEDAEEGNDEL